MPLAKNLPHNLPSEGAADPDGVAIGGGPGPSSQSASEGPPAVRTELSALIAKEPPSEWLSAHGDYLFRYALLRVKSRALAEDLVQEALLAALKGWAQFEGRSSVRTWLTGILLNKIIDHFRTAERRLTSTTEPRELAEVVDGHFSALGIWNSVLSDWGNGDWGNSPHSQLERRGFLVALSGCIQKLPQTAQRVFVLKVVDGISTEDICNTLGLTSSHVWVLVHRARMALRDCIEKNWGSVTKS